MPRCSKALVVALGVGVAIACSSGPSQPSPPALPICTPVSADPDLANAVWGFADLHAHPVADLAFQPMPILWGKSRNGRWDTPNTLTQFPACPVETHLEETSKPFTRTAHSIILPLLNGQRNTSHTPIASGDSTYVEGWPDGRDVLHNGMPLASIYRAYHGGLRLLFASVTDSQVLASLLQGPQFADVFIPNRTFDYESAKRQLKAILELADDNKDWMEVAECPEAARRIIRGGKLAIVLSLEEDGLSAADILRLIDVDKLPVGHVVPVHLVDNTLGGTTAFNDIFNTATSMLSSIYEKPPLQYMQVSHTGRHSSRLSWPLRIAPSAPPLLFSIGRIDLGWYRSLGYEDLCACNQSSDDPARVVRLTGHDNAMGLRAPDDLSTLMSRGLMLDVTHMSYAATQSALDLASMQKYPMIASHGTIARMGELVRSERELAPEHAVMIQKLGGLVGLGTGGITHETPVLVTRGAPVLRFTHDGTLAACVHTRGTSAPACGVRPRIVAPPVIDGSMNDPVVRSLRVDLGPSSAPGSPQVRVDMLAPCAPGTPCAQRQAVGARFTKRMTCASDLSCTVTIDLTAPVPTVSTGPLDRTCATATSTEPMAFHVSDVGSITLLAQNDCEWEAKDWSVPGVTVFADAEKLTLPLSGHEMGDPSLRFEGARKSMVLYERDDRRWASDGVGPDASIVRVRMKSSARSADLPGASISDRGANVCVALLTGSDCQDILSIDAVADGCPAGFVSMNRHGSWPKGAAMDAWVKVPSNAAICGVALDVATWSVPTKDEWEVDELRIDRTTDPVLEWRDDYAELMKTIFGGKPGFIAFGTDTNGFAPQIPISGIRPSWPTPYSSRGCSSSPALRELTIPLDHDATRAVRIDQRGLATYGMLTDVLAAIAQADPAKGQPVIDSVLLSAERTLRVWEATRAAAIQLGGHVVPCKGMP